MASTRPGMQEARSHEIQVDGAESRLDQYLAQVDLGLTRSRLRQLIAEGNVLVNGVAVKPAHRIRSGDRVRVTVPPPRPSVAIAQDIPISVVYQDAALVVIDKPPGLSVHPGPGHPDQTLVNGLLALCPDIQGIGGEIRPGIVHRLDKDTSGLLIAAKTQDAHVHLSQQIKDRAVEKGYLALVEGAPSRDGGLIDVPIGRDPRRRTRMAVVAGDGRAAPATGCWKGLAHTACWNCNCTQGAPTRPGCTWRGWGTRCWATRCTAAAVRCWTVISCTLTGWPSRTPPPATPWSSGPQFPPTWRPPWRPRAAGPEGGVPWAYPAWTKRERGGRQLPPLLISRERPVRMRYDLSTFLP